MRKAASVTMGLLLSMSAFAARTGSAQGQTAHGKDYWRGIAATHYEVPQGEKAFELAKELSGYLKSSDSELRDDLAYSILAEWILVKNALGAEDMLALEAQWRGNLRAGIGESGTDSVYARSFSALCLAAIAEREMKSPFLGETRYRLLLDATLEYLAQEKDLRGFDEKKGWIHATAHTADLLAALARHPLFGEQDQARALEAIGRRVETARTIFSFGEQDRLANALAAMAGRADFSVAGFESWVNRMDKADSSIWKDSPPKLEGLQRFENDTYVLSALVARISQGQMTSGSERARKAALDSLKRR